MGTHDVLLAVVDSGIDYNHLDLSANYVPLGYDWAYSDTDPMDDYGHGTKVAGVVAAVTNNGIGIAGMAQVKVMAEKVFDKNGEGYVMTNLENWKSRTLMVISGIFCTVNTRSDVEWKTK